MNRTKTGVGLASLLVVGSMLTGCKTASVEPENKVTVVANITAKEGQADLVKGELMKLLEPTHAEAGCINYDLHQDNKNPAHFLFFENWESYELWQDHMKAPHLKDFGAATEGAIADFTIYEMVPVK